MIASAASRGLIGALLIGLLGGLGQRLQAQTVVTIDSTASVIAYTGSAPLHDWTGTSRSVTGRFVLGGASPDSRVARIRVPVASFDSGNNRRDRKMRAVTEAQRYPMVRFRASRLQRVADAAAPDGTQRWAVAGTLTFHGQSHRLRDTVQVTQTAGRVRVRARFPVSLTRFGVERPSFLFFTVADTIRIDATLVGRIRRR
ncbi:YceI family protein [Salisaeta longa]|uniref:YceI family protein n=1 Tax=Salisaeta longa TaxID=503170 RepID=UPI0003B64C01|nr:YceI family protein [Salisaeta longa]